jgi:type IV fimbrial biogenesis protein FimT
MKQLRPQTRLKGKGSSPSAGRDEGFTLVELMITVAVLAVLVSLAAPSFSRLIASNNVRSGASDLQMAMLRARNEAITRNASIIVEKSATGWKDGWVVKEGSNMIESYGGFNGLTVTGSANSVTYNSAGRVSAASTVEFKSEKYPEEIRCLSVEISGRPLITKAGC